LTPIDTTVILSEPKDLWNFVELTMHKSEIFESLASCFAFRCSVSLNSPQDESAVADMTG
jgi:hypothetical protein